MCRVAVTPGNRSRCFVVEADVAPNLPREISDGGTHAAREEIALDFRKPQFNLVAGCAKS
jgi:hypothetical protein